MTSHFQTSPMLAAAAAMALSAIPFLESAGQPAESFRQAAGQGDAALVSTVLNSLVQVERRCDSVPNANDQNTCAVARFWQAELARSMSGPT